MIRKPKRLTVRRKYLERRLYKTERRITKFNLQAVEIRHALKTLEDREIKILKAREEVLNKELHRAAIASVPTSQGGDDASDKTK